MIPIYELLKNIGLSQSLVGLILAESGGGHVIFLMLFSSFYASIPGEMEEAATIDGANFVQTYGSVMFPLAKPIMVTVVIMQFIWTWNSFLLPLSLRLTIRPCGRSLWDSTPYEAKMSLTGPASPPAPALQSYRLSACSSHCRSIL